LGKLEAGCFFSLISQSSNTDIMPGKNAR
jgi:hypothetical protein